MRTFIEVDSQRQVRLIFDAVAPTYEQLLPEFEMRLRVAMHFTEDLRARRYWNDYSIACS